MDKIFGLDLGTNSIGWALRNPFLADNQIEKFGVLTFNKGIGIGKTGEYSYAAERTKKRATRRLYQSRKYRLWATLEHLIQEGYCPLSIENLNKWRHYNKEEARKNNNAGRVYPFDDLLFDAWTKLDFNLDGKPDYISPYQLRKELSEIKLDLNIEQNRFKLGRALYHIAQRRGFKSSRKGADDMQDKLESANNEVEFQYSEKKKSKKLKELFPDFDPLKPIGVFLANKENEGYRIRLDITQYLIRENFKDEIKYIFKLQELPFEGLLYSKLVETRTNKNDGSIFFKRPLRSQKGLIGKCTLEPNKYRSPISHPSFEIFRAWSFLNNIKYKSSKDEDWKSLPLELKQNLLDAKFFRKSVVYFPFSEIENFIKTKGNNWILNYKSKTTVTGCPVSARLKEIFGEDYLTLKIDKFPSIKSGKDYYDIGDIWHVLFFYEDQEYVAEFAKEKLKLSPEKTKQFIIAWSALPVGYAMLSLNAINKINVFLQKGLIYTEAVLLANIPEVIGRELWVSNDNLFLDTISNLISENWRQKIILNIVNSLISRHKNLEATEKFGYRDNKYQLNKSDFQDISNAIEENFGLTRWMGKSENEKSQIFSIAKDCYQAYFVTSGLVRKDINNNRYFLVQSEKVNYYKGDSGYYRLPKLIDTLSEFIQIHFDVTDKEIQKIYHPSEISIYPPAKPEKDGHIKLGSPKTGSFKNPMAMRTLHELRRLMNYMIETNQIDSDTRIVVEVARDLNDANKRWAIEAWQKQRESENAEFSLVIEQMVFEQTGVLRKSNSDIDKLRLWYEQNDEDSMPPIADVKKDIKGIKWNENRKNSYKEIAAKKDLVDKYRLWKEQECRCLYTGKIINIADLFNDNVIDFEHTIPRSISFDNSLANLTVCYADYNRSVKKNQIPYNLYNYDEIIQRVEKWKDKVERIKQQIEFWKTKSKKAIDKSSKDDAIRQRHLWQMDLDYWKNKVDRFTMVEVTNGFKNSQLIDTQLISKYALHYLKSYFEKVDVQKGSNTAVFRKIFKLQASDEEKDRSKHSHHAKDAAVLTLIPVSAKREEILKKYYEHREKKLTFTLDAYKGFKREFVWSIDDNVLINNITNEQTLTPGKRIIRKRGKVQFIDGTDEPRMATGDSIRGQLHLDTFYGAIKPSKRDENGHIARDEKNKIIQNEKIKYVLRVPFEYKAKADAPGFKTLDEIEKGIVDEGLKKQIREQVEKAGGLKEAFELGIYMLDKHGNKINRIRHIRCWASVAEPLKIKKQTNLSKTDYKQYYYAANATNSFFALYEGDEKIGFEYRNLFDTSKILSLNNIVTERDLFEKSLLVKKGAKDIVLNLKYILKAGLKVIFIKDKEEDIKLLSNQELLKRFYQYTNFEKNGNSARLNFKYHLEARSKIPDVFVESEINFEIPKPTLRFSYSKYRFLVEGYEFIIGADGVIQWK
ncbi:hypothetical protein Dfri01_61550 [Dyadobacter frigoris]|uniref:type II CRISPR RNA-guided endonuclease Cas9 n=1 Tax=Dyadobacter frigoris TaxID=2576211 RepID=UPI0024A495A5|nr:type II CRISPR RNA-guided endonuclease Cas9 [Dyadobacter frigoris]GLU56694.1 hypothetical protein Dfri01_61550 [Dyadobacter frigoris]